MKQLSTEVTINAPVERVWQVLTDFPSYGDWNTFMPRIEGDFTIGGRLEVRLSPPGGRAMTFKPTITLIEPKREFRWLGRLGMPGIFDGEHGFRLERTDSGDTRLRHFETFRGILAPLLMAMIGKSTHAGFEAMNRALKERAEA